MHFLFAYVCLYAFMCMHHTSAVCMPFLQDGQFDKFCASRQVLTQTDKLQQHMSELFKQRWRENSSSAVGKLEFCFTWKPLIIYISILDASESHCMFLFYCDCCIHISYTHSHLLSVLFYFMCSILFLFSVNFCPELTLCSWQDIEIKKTNSLLILLVHNFITALAIVELLRSQNQVFTAKWSDGMTFCTCTMILFEHFQAHRHLCTDLLWL